MTLDAPYHDLAALLQIKHLPQMPLHLKTALRAQFSVPHAPRAVPAQFIVIGGPPGAGKSFFYQHLNNHTLLPAGHVLHDPDCLLQAIPEYKHDYCIDPHAAFQLWELPVRQLSHELLLEALLQGQSVVYVRTLAHADSLDLLAYCKNVLGYTLTIHLLTSPIDLAIQRSLARENSVQRHLSLDLITQRHEMVMSHIPRLQIMADHYFQYDNSLNDRLPILKKRVG